VKQALVSKQRGSCQKEYCFSRTMPARTQLKLADLLKHPVYSPDLAPCSPTLKNT
jgi:hypothetical protein